MSSSTKLTFDTGERSPDDVEREVQTVVEEATDKEPKTYQYAGNVVWLPRTPEIEDVQDVDVPRILKTSFNDTVDAGHGELFARIDGEFVKVDSAGSPEPDFGEHVLDYFRINYGIAPWYRYSKLDDPGTLRRPSDRQPWSSIRSSSMFVAPLFNHEADAARQLHGRTSAFHPQAVRYFALHGTADFARYESFLRTIPEVDEETRAVVAAALWEPSPLTADEEPPISLLQAHLSLVDDSVPEVRIGAFMGAIRVLNALDDRFEAAHEDPKLDSLVREFYEAYEGLLADPDPRIRERTVRCLREGYSERHILSDELWMRIDFELRWRVVRAIETNMHDEGLGTMTSKEIAAEAFRGEHAAVRTLVDYVYDTQGPSHKAVRAALAEFAMDEPAAALPALEPTIAAVEDRTELVADLRLLAALTTERPDRVASVADELAAIFDDPGEKPDDGGDETVYKSYTDQDDPEEKQRAAAVALSRLPADGRPVEIDRLSEVTQSITHNPYGRSKVSPNRVVTLSAVDPPSAVEKLRRLPDRISDERDDDGFSRSNVHSAIYEVSKQSPDVITSALSDLIALFEDPATVSPALALAITRTAAQCPEDVADYSETIAVCLGHSKPIVREATATTLVEIGRVTGVSEPYATLIGRGEECLDIEQLEAIWNRTDRTPATPVDWPAGTLVSDPTTLKDSVTACLEAQFDDHEQLAELLNEIYAADPAVAKAVLELLFDRHSDAVLPSSSYRTGVPTLLADTTPDLLVRTADSMVEILADRSFEPRSYPDDEYSTATPEAKSLEDGLLAVVRTDPSSAKAAIESHYRTLGAFADEHQSTPRVTIVREIYLETQST